MKDEKLDLEKWEKVRDAICNNNFRPMTNQIISYVKRLRHDLKLQEQDNDRIIQCSKAAVESIQAKNAKLLEEVEKYKTALKFYADPETYFAIAMIADPPCGIWLDDQSWTGEDLRWKCGMRARIALDCEIDQPEDEDD